MGPRPTALPANGWLPAGAILGTCLAGWLLVAAPPPADTKAAKSSVPTFEQDVQPVLAQVCSNCHNADLKSGNLDITNYSNASSLTTDPAGWAKILARLKAGEMPPPGIPGPSPESLSSLIGFVQSALDKSQKPDAGRVIAHRLNRS